MKLSRFKFKFVPSLKEQFRCITPFETKSSPPYCCLYPAANHHWLDQISTLFRKRVHPVLLGKVHSPVSQGLLPTPQNTKGVNLLDKQVQSHNRSTLVVVSCLYQVGETLLVLVKPRHMILLLNVPNIYILLIIIHYFCCLNNHIQVTSSIYIYTYISLK